MPTLETMRRKSFVGSAARVADKIRALAEEFDLSEIVVNTWAHDPQVRRDSYSMLAREFDLRTTLL